MKKSCFAFAIVLYMIWLIGCGRQQNIITESDVLDSAISAAPLSEEELENLENTYSDSSVSASEPEVFNYEYSKRFMDIPLRKMKRY